MGPMIIIFRRTAEKQKKTNRGPAVEMAGLTVPRYRDENQARLKHRLAK